MICVFARLVGREWLVVSSEMIIFALKIVDYGKRKDIKSTGADIVVSSSWKYLMDYGDFLEMWKARNLPGFVTDVTPTPNGCRNRGDEIDAWIEDCPTECQYVIIDDLYTQNFNEHQIPRLLVVNPFYGLDEETAKRAVEILINSTHTPK